MDAILDFNRLKCEPLKANGISPNPPEGTKTPLSQVDLSTLTSLLNPQMNSNSLSSFNISDVNNLLNMNGIKYPLLPQYSQSLLSSSQNAAAQLLLSSSNNKLNIQSLLQEAILSGQPPVKKAALESGPSSPISTISSNSITSGSMMKSESVSPDHLIKAITPSPGSVSRKSSVSSTGSRPSRKPPAPIPDEKKDEAYYERRRKNNDAAKRSRDARRRKEEEIADRASFLEQENIQLKSQISLLKAENAKFQMLLFTQNANNNTQKALENFAKAVQEVKTGSE
ncbi:Protein giant [Strongyloides ratti]|uniref:Protein giant n=1 Tax=Strongyloides ratti TaxID=34506 RepID=A0A090L2I1_STRRB|nr:Protein giant [Strongyloides ratti]CEF64031.1 Protein giant [Strongyloides ratti]